MVTFNSCVTLIIGLSLLLTMAGVNTSSNILAGFGIDVSPDSSGGGFNVSVQKLSYISNPVSAVFSSPLLAGLIFTIGIFAGVTGLRSGLGGTFGIAETIKTTALAALIGLVAAQVCVLVIYLNGIGDFGGITRNIALLIYLVLVVATVISGLDWIGGGK